MILGAIFGMFVACLSCMFVDVYGWLWKQGRPKQFSDHFIVKYAYNIYIYIYTIIHIYIYMCVSYIIVKIDLVQIYLGCVTRVLNVSLFLFWHRQEAVVAQQPNQSMSRKRRMATFHHRGAHKDDIRRHEMHWELRWDGWMTGWI